MTKIALEEATIPQLKKFGTEVLGLSFKVNESKPSILSKIATVRHDLEEIDIADDEEGDAAQTKSAPAVAATPVKKARFHSTSGKFDPVVTLNIQIEKAKGGERPVPVGVNGTVMLIPRGKDVEVPYRYFEALEKAVLTESDQDEETHEITSRDVYAYSYQVKRMPPEEEIQAWLDAQQ